MLGSLEGVTDCVRSFRSLAFSHVIRIKLKLIVDTQNKPILSNLFVYVLNWFHWRQSITTQPLGCSIKFRGFHTMNFQISSLFGLDYPKMSIPHLTILNGNSFKSSNAPHLLCSLEEKHNLVFWEVNQPLNLHPFYECGILCHLPWPPLHQLTRNYPPPSPPSVI